MFQGPHVLQRFYILKDTQERELQRRTWHLHKIRRVKDRVGGNIRAGTKGTEGKANVFLAV